MAGGSYLHLLPISISIVLPSTFIITYIWSVLSRHVYPILPNISDTGSLPPESCLFSFLLNISAALIGFAVYVRYKEVREYVKVRGASLGKVGTRTRTINFWATIFGFLSCGGLDIAANFQQSNLTKIHYFGVLLCFFCAALYVTLQSFLSYLTIPELNTHCMLILRIFLSIATIIAAIVNTVSGTIAYSEFSGNRTVFLQWEPSDKGWAMHVTSAVTEWFIVVTLGGFILSYYQNFSRLIFNAPALETKTEPKPDRVRIRRFQSFPSILQENTNSKTL